MTPAAARIFSTLHRAASRMRWAAARPSMNLARLSFDMAGEYCRFGRMSGESARCARRAWVPCRRFILVGMARGYEELSSHLRAATRTDVTTASKAGSYFSKYAASAAE